MINVQSMAAPVSAEASGVEDLKRAQQPDNRFIFALRLRSALPMTINCISKFSRNHVVWSFKLNTKRSLFKTTDSHFITYLQMY